jgi:hypothetical protein
VIAVYQSTMTWWRNKMISKKLTLDMNPIRKRCITCPIYHPALREVAPLQFKLRNAMDSANIAQRKSRRLSKLVDLHRACAKEYLEEMERLRVEVIQLKRQNSLPLAFSGMPPL